MDFLLKKVRKTKSCWLWFGFIGPSGYGEIKFNYKTHRVHRVSYELSVGTIPSGLYICHRCDIRNCVNPSHLFLGTHEDNCLDMVKKKRHIFGKKQWECKLSEKNVLNIRRLYKNGARVVDLAKKFGVHPNSIWNITNRTTWKHI